MSENNTLKLCEGGYCSMAVPVKTTPVFRGEDAKKLIYNLEHPTDKSELFKRCAESAKLFTIK